MGVESTKGGGRGEGGGAELDPTRIVYEQHFMGGAETIRETVREEGEGTRKVPALLWLLHAIDMPAGRKHHASSSLHQLYGNHCAHPQSYLLQLPGTAAAASHAALTTAVAAAGQTPSTPAAATLVPTDHPLPRAPSSTAPWHDSQCAQEQRQ